MPFYVSPEQVMKDKSDYARKGIARGRSVLALQYADGILFVGENPSNALHKISEIYDRIAFAAVGKYNEFENLRLAGVRYADLRGYQYDRRDVTGRGLANAYAQTLGTIFTESGKPYEVELVVAEVGSTQADDQMYRLTYDGSVADEHGFVVMGGNSEPIATYVREHHDPKANLATVLQLAVTALVQPVADGTEARTIAGEDLEAAVLDRTRPRRAFKRLLDKPLEKLLAVKK
jgi:proteasome alpha subunit